MILALLLVGCEKSEGQKQEVNKDSHSFGEIYEIDKGEYICFVMAGFKKGGISCLKK